MKIWGNDLRYLYLTFECMNVLQHCTNPEEVCNSLTSVNQCKITELRYGMYNYNTAKAGSKV